MTAAEDPAAAEPAPVAAEPEVVEDNREAWLDLALLDGDAHVLATAARRGRPLPKKDQA